MSSNSLEGAHWYLAQLSGQAVQGGDGPRAAHLFLDAEKKRLTGSGGCNRLVAAYTVQDTTLRFGDIAATKMACPRDMALERQFVQALGQVAGWRMRGSELELLDGAGQPVAGFRAGDAPRLGRR